MRARALLAAAAALLAACLGGPPPGVPAAAPAEAPAAGSRVPPEVAPEVAPDVAPEVDWRDVAPLVHRACAPCHREDGAAPFPLRTHGDVARHAGEVLAVVERGYMPPWKPVAGYGAFRGERRLAAEEVRLLRRWIEAGAPEGEPRPGGREPAPEEPPERGEPDVVLEMAAAFPVDAERFEQFRCFTIPTAFGEDRWIRSIELRPSSPRAVHHMIVYADGSGRAHLARGDDGKPGLAGMCVDRVPIDDLLGGWVPGMLPVRLPDGLGLRLPAGADLVIDAHFQATGRPEEERTRVALRFAEGEPSASVLLVRLGAHGMVIPPGEASYAVSDRFVLPVDVEAIAVLPHAHYLCTDVRAWAEPPAGGEVPLIWIDDWDFDWQDFYRYAEPVVLPRGSVLRCTFRYDNSAANPENPHAPPRRVIDGSRSIDEMASLFLQVVLRDEEQAGELRAALERHAREQLEALEGLEGWWQYLVQAHDRDGDGSLDAAEDAAASAFLEGLWDERARYMAVLDVDGDGTLDDEEEARYRRALRLWRGER